MAIERTHYAATELSETVKQTTERISGRLTSYHYSGKLFKVGDEQIEVKVCNLGIRENDFEFCYVDFPKDLSNFETSILLGEWVNWLHISYRVTHLAKVAILGYDRYELGPQDRPLSTIEVLIPNGMRPDHFSGTVLQVLKE